MRRRNAGATLAITATEMRVKLLRWLWIPAPILLAVAIEFAIYQRPPWERRREWAYTCGYPTSSKTYHRTSECPTLENCNDEVLTGPFPNVERLAGGPCPLCYVK